VKHEPFIAETLLAPQGKYGIRFGKAVQLSLLPELQTPLRFALRLHHATHLHFDLRIQILHTLFSFAMPEAPCLDPDKPVRATLMEDHDPSYLESERRIPEGEYGAGPTMPVDLGTLVPLVQAEETYELEALAQIARGDFRFTLEGHHLKGAWQLRLRQGKYWGLHKLPDEHASTTRILTLDRSIKTGRTLEELPEASPGTAALPKGSVKKPKRSKQKKWEEAGQDSFLGE
jgi:bifunctional non-homologous end joining protein LigD